MRRAAYMSSGYNMKPRLARRRYMKVDPDNRLVADTLEADWNGKLRLHAEAVEEYERRKKHQAATLGAEARRRILGLAEQLPQSGMTRALIPASANAIVRLLVDDVNLDQIGDDHSLCAVCAAGLRVPFGASIAHLPIAQIRSSNQNSSRRSISYSSSTGDREIADILNQDGWQTGKASRSPEEVAFIRMPTNWRADTSGYAAVVCSTTREVAASLASLKPPCTSGAVRANHKML